MRLRTVSWGMIANSSCRRCAEESRDWCLCFRLVNSSAEFIPKMFNWREVRAATWPGKNSDIMITHCGHYDSSNMWSCIVLLQDQLMLMYGGDNYWEYDFISISCCSQSSLDLQGHCSSSAPNASQTIDQNLHVHAQL